MNIKIIHITVATALSLLQFNAVAEDMYQGAWYVMPGASYIDTDNDLDANHGGGLFLKFGKEVSPSWDIQGGFTYNRASEDTGIAGVGGHYKQITLGADALYMFSRDRFRPFLLAGAGVARNNVDYSNFPSLNNAMRTSWMTNIGLGAQFLLNETFGLQADIRHQWSRSDAEAPNSGFDASGTMNNTLFNLGAIFRFGVPAKTASAVDMPEQKPAPEQYVEKKPAPKPVPEPMPVAKAEPMPVKDCTQKFVTITVSAEKLFGFDKIQMQEGSKPLLDEVVKQLKAHPEFKLVMVTGHTDRIGTSAYNQKLSEDRANQVRDYLVTEGIEGSRLQSVGKGESEPVVTCTGMKGNKLIECLQPNRRVIIEDKEQHLVESATNCN